MDFEIELDMQGRTDLHEGGAKAILGHHNLRLRYRGSDNGFVSIEVLEGSTLSLSEEGEKATEVTFPTDVQLARVNVQEVPDDPGAIEHAVNDAVSAKKFLDIPNFPTIGEPTTDYLICVGRGVALDLINAVLECRRSGARGLRAILRCLRAKGLSIGAGVVGRLLRCLTKLVGLDFDAGDDFLVGK